jgi:superfamily II DNA/RNA helicase
MLDMGFIPDIEEICTKLPAQRQTLLFSATMPPVIKKLADKFLSNPKSIEVARPATAGANIAQMLVPVAERDKRDMLRKLLASEGVESAIIFCNRKTMVRDLNQSLRRNGYKSGEIHGDIDQASRIAELDRFKSGEINLLVASDVAARGLDIKGVSHVFNFDAPWHPDDYVHRIGRTGRAGATGKAFTFVTRNDAEAVANIEKLIGTTIPRLETGASIEAVEGEETPRSRGRGGARKAPAGKKPADQPVREAKADAAESEPRPERAEREPRAAREPRTEREARPEREPRPPREPRAERPARAERGGHNDAPRRHESTRDDGPDDGWNGPTPAFLNFGFN